MRAQAGAANGRLRQFWEAIEASTAKARFPPHENRVAAGGLAAAANLRPRETLHRRERCRPYRPTRCANGCTEISAVIRKRLDRIRRSMKGRCHKAVTVRPLSRRVSLG